jgi:hypothetical protein
MEIRMSTAATVRALREDDQDFEWYPSSSEMIALVVKDLYRLYGGCGKDSISVLDIGAGDGRVLTAISKNMAKTNLKVKCYAIEKAIHHQNNMPKEIGIIGTEFDEQALADKRVNVIFCNPPYSQFEHWMHRILREGSASYAYFIVPRRWRDNVRLKHALESRKSSVKSLGEFDFEDADRAARAKVEIIRVDFGKENAFNSVIEDMLPELNIFDVKVEDDEEFEMNDKITSGSGGIVDALVDAYDKRLMELIENYRGALKVDVEILLELGVSKQGVLAAIKMKIEGLKNHYWKMLFDEMKTITNRLASKQRKLFLSSLQDKVSVDFTRNNIYAVLIWVSKWANDYCDEQLIDLFRTLSNDSNVEKYKSNDRVWTKCDWRYQEKRYDFSGNDNNVSHYKLEYRMVISHGGISTSGYSWERQENRGLDVRAAELLMDIVTVANNLGFSCNDSHKNYEWKSNKQNVLKLHDGKPLVAVRAFKNGNMHLHFNPKLMLAINVEAGRLLKWIRNPAEAVSEMDLKGEEAKQAVEVFGSQFRISPENGFLKLMSVG